MSRTWRFVAAVITAALGVTAPAAAWNDVGHRLISRLAWDRLTPAVRAEVAASLRQHPRFDQDFAPWIPPRERRQPATADAWIFATASTWPDLVRRLDEPARTLYNRPSWHFVNEPLLLDDAARHALADGIPGNRERDWSPATTAELNISQALHRVVSRLSDPATPAAAAAVDWCWLLHLAADLHQPLHTTALYSARRFPHGDRGGNQIPIADPKAGPEPLNLHAVWDRLLDGGQSATRTSRPLAEARLRRVGEAAAPEADFALWLDESHQLARTAVYTAPILRAISAGEAADLPLPPLALSARYRRQARAIARERAALAGGRLAALIEQIVSTRHAASH